MRTLEQDKRGYLLLFVNTHMLPADLYSSRAPTAGGQYHWVSEFAPPRYQKFLSYLVGTGRPLPNVQHETDWSGQDGAV